MEYKDYYQVLGISKDASQIEIKQAYRKLARKFHPDVSSERDAEERFKDIGEAYEVLKDPEKRAAYDQLGSTWKTGQGDFNPPPDWDAGFEFHDGTSSESSVNTENFSDFFENLFGQHRNNRQTANDFAGFNMRGNDSHAKIFIDLEDAYQGATKSLTLKTTTLNEQGRPVLKDRVLNVKIPKGVRQGQHIRLQGLGGPGAGKGVSGDLYLELEFNPHSIYKVLKHDVFLVVPILPWEAALGCNIKIPTPSGKVELKIPLGTSGGKRIRFKGRGIPAKIPGDFFVTLEMGLPPKVSDKEKSLYEALRQENADFNPRLKLGV